MNNFIYNFTSNKYLLESNQIEELSKAIEYLLFERNNILTDISGNILIERTTKKQVYEYIIDILNEEKKPLHINEIYSRLEKIEKGITKSAEAVRSAIGRWLDSFFIVTDSSTYGLKKWEEAGLFLGGSIRELVERYLLRHDEPKHIYEITLFILKHRDTTKFSIYSNLQQSEDGKFILYKAGFVGLSVKDYSLVDINYNRISPSSIRAMRQKCFKDAKSIYIFDKMIEYVMNKNKVYRIQVESYFNEKIKDGSYLLKNNFLYLK